MRVLTSRESWFRLLFVIGVTLWLLAPSVSRWASGFLVGLTVGIWVAEYTREPAKNGKKSR